MRMLKLWVGIGVLVLSTSRPGGVPFAWADTDGPKLGGIPADQDTAILIKKNPSGNALAPNDFEVVSSEEEVVGDPAGGQKEAYASWKAACAAWKKDMREMNQGNIIALNCNTAASQSSGNGQFTYKSTGSYKVRVKVRGAK